MHRFNAKERAEKYKFAGSSSCPLCLLHVLHAPKNLEADETMSIQRWQDNVTPTIELHHCGYFKYEAIMSPLYFLRIMYVYAGKVSCVPVDTVAPVIAFVQVEFETVTGSV